LDILALKFKIDNGKLTDVVVVTVTNLKQRLLSDFEGLDILKNYPIGYYSIP